MTARDEVLNLFSFEGTVDRRKHWTIIIGNAISVLIANEIVTRLLSAHPEMGVLPRFILGTAPLIASVWVIMATRVKYGRHKAARAASASK